MMNFNIQLFADNLQNTTATMSKEMKTFYEKRLIDQQGRINLSRKDAVAAIAKKRAEMNRQ